MPGQTLPVQVWSEFRFLVHLQQTGRDFKVLAEDGGWALYEAAYEAPRSVNALDGTNNVSDEPCAQGVEIVRGAREVAVGGYHDQGARTIEDFTDPDLYRLSESNQYEKCVKGGKSQITDGMVAMEDVTQSLALSYDTNTGEQCLLYSETNSTHGNTWTGIGRLGDLRRAGRRRVLAARHGTWASTQCLRADAVAGREHGCPRCTRSRVVSGQRQRDPLPLVPRRGVKQGREAENE